MVKDHSDSGRERKPAAATWATYMVRAFTHGVMGHWIDPSSWTHIELFLVPASAPQLVYQML